MMEKIITIKNRFLASIAAFAVVIWPMTALAAEEASEEGNNKSEEGSAAGENAVRTAVGGINAGTVAAIVAIAAAAAALSFERIAKNLRPVTPRLKLTTNSPARAVTITAKRVNFQ